MKHYKITVEITEYIEAENEIEATMKIGSTLMACQNPKPIQIEELKNFAQANQTEITIWEADPLIPL